MGADLKLYFATVTEIVGANIYNVFIRDLDITCKRHVQQSLPIDRNIKQRNDLNVKPEDVPEGDVSIPNVSEANNDVNVPNRTLTSINDMNVPNR